MQSKLALRKVSPNGSVVAEITCLSGYVSVFRSSSSDKLDDYERSLFEDGYPGRFVFEIDNAPVSSPSEVLCVGVGTFTARNGAVVRQLLLNAGYTPQRIEELSTQCQMKLMLNTAWSSLSPEDLRKLELLIALKQSSRVLLIRDPFGGMNKESREMFAALLAQAAVQDNKIVVISRLSDRPDSWVGNAAIARIDLDLIRQATIGFDPALLEQVRSRVANQVKVKEPKATVAQQVAAKVAGKSYYKYHFIAVTCLVLVIGTVGSVVGAKRESPVVAPAMEPVAAVAPMVVELKPSAAEPSAAPQALALYSPEIGQSIISAFRGEDELLLPGQDEQVDIMPVTEQQKRDNTQDIFKSLQEVELAPGAHARGEDPYDNTDSDSSLEFPAADPWEHAREEMRRKFLESLS